MSDVNPIELQKALKGAEYPADREELVKIAQHNGADSALVERLESLTEDDFDGPDAVSRAVFGSG
ncbi:DUF2795 domain-containing protein [Streptomyces sp. NPDC048415]|jgi:hypothetical protein|uniref:DUF2795 domain-containing protein n=1 Tax=Streptomyces sp. NPDC048415 TaxID=3154822 RepID=UPI003444E986